MKIIASGADVTKEAQFSAGDHNIVVTVANGSTVEARIKSANGSYIISKSWNQDASESFNGKGEFQFFIPDGCSLVIYDR